MKPIILKRKYWEFSSLIVVKPRILLGCHQIGATVSGSAESATDLTRIEMRIAEDLMRDASSVDMPLAQVGPIIRHVTSNAL